MTPTRIDFLKRVRKLFSSDMPYLEKLSKRAAPPPSDAMMTDPEQVTKPPVGDEYHEETEFPRGEKKKSGRLVPFEMEVFSSEGAVKAWQTRRAGYSPTKEASSPHTSAHTDFKIAVAKKLDSMKDKVKVELKHDEDGTHIASVEAIEKGKGHGSTAMKAITDLADKHGIPLSLGASPYGKGGLKANDLRAFYERHGFHGDKDSVYMTREPKAKLSTDSWYDRNTKSWVTQQKDAHGNQVGEAEYTHQKPKKKFSSLLEVLQPLLFSSESSKRAWITIRMNKGLISKEEGERLLKGGTPVAKPAKAATKKDEPDDKKSRTKDKPSKLERVSDAAGRKQADPGPVGTASPYVGRRPPLVTVSEGLLPKPRDFLGDKFSGQLDDHQRLGVNLALDRFSTQRDQLQGDVSGQKIGKGFLLGDGTGVGKSREILATADQMADISGKPSLIVTQNKQVIAGSFTSDANAMGIDLNRMLPAKEGEAPAHAVQLATYSDLSSGMFRGRQFGLVVYDEAHNLKNVEAKKTMEARFLKTDHEMFATATPMDTPTAASYFLGKITGLEENEVQRRLGYHIITTTAADGTEFQRAELKQGNTWDTVQKETMAMRDEAIREGGMVRREYPFFGTIDNTKLKLSEEQHAEQDKIDAYWQDRIDTAPWKMKMVNAGLRLAELSRWAEQQKIDPVFDLMKKDLAAGKNVIVMAENVNPTQLHGLGEERKSFLGEFSRKLTEAGIDHAKIFGGGKKAEEVAKFQDGKVRVAIATPLSGGTGVNLDDTRGDRPRSMYVVTANYSGDVFQQVLGRASRRNTKSPVELHAVSFDDSHADQRRSIILDNKIKTLKAIQQGADVDTAQGSWAELGGKSASEQRPPKAPREPRPEAPPAAGPLSTRSSVLPVVAIDRPLPASMVSASLESVPKGAVTPHVLPTEHITKQGKTLTGYIVSGIEHADAKKIDEYTFRKGAGFFIRDKHEEKLKAAGVNFSQETIVMKSKFGALLESIRPAKLIFSSEAAKKAWETRKRGGGEEKKEAPKTPKEPGAGTSLSTDPNAIVRKDRPPTVTPEGKKSFPPSEYAQGGKPIKDPKILARLAEIKVKPGWTDVKINPDPKAELLATGKDAAGRTQYLYSAAHSEKSAVAKFSRVKDFSSKVKDIRDQVGKDLSTSDAKKFQTALAVKLIDSTFIRVGSDADTKAVKQAYGATTLEARHIKVDGSTVQLKFIGKKGVPANIKVNDAELASNLSKALKGKSGRDKVFDHADRDTVTSYLKQFGDYSAKDFRTYHGTRLALDLIKKSDVPSDQKGLKDLVKNVATKVSDALNNTPAMAKSSYINPAVWAPLFAKGLKKL